MEKIVLLTNSIDGLYSFRRELVEKLTTDDFELYILSPKSPRYEYFNGLGCVTIETDIDRRGTNPVKDFSLLLHYLRTMVKIKPDIVLTYTVKPNIYGGIVCRLLGIPSIANITGLGSSIENKGINRALIMRLYKTGLKKAKAVFFQNHTNKQFFIENKLVQPSFSRDIPGSGVNTNQHILEEYPTEDGELKLLFVGRIMKEKGVDELFEAATTIRSLYPNTVFDFIGRKEEEYDEKLSALEKKGIIKYHGLQDKESVHRFMTESHVIVNPSYHEGMSNVLLEAASTGRPVLASNVPGCSETFDENISGFGFEVKNAGSLTNTIIRFIELPYDKKRAMGLAGRAKMEKEFDRNIVISAYMKEINIAMERKK